MKKYILIIFLIMILFITSCNNNNSNEPSLDLIKFNKEYYYNGDEITFSVPNEIDNSYSLYYTTVSDNEGIQIIDDTHFIAKTPGIYTITVKNFDYPEWEHIETIKIYSHLINLSATTYILPINKQVEITINNYDNLYEQVITDFNFKSNNENIADNVNNDNIFTAKSPGIFNVEVTSKINPNVKSMVEIKVSDGSDFLIDPISHLGELKVAEEMEINVQNGIPSDFVWTTSNSEIIKIVKYDTKLKVIGVNEGTTNISGYKITEPTIRTTYKLTVKGIMDVDYVGRLIHTALDEVGTKEEGNNHQKYGVWYGNDGEPWCATFVSWCWYHSGLSNELLLKYQGCYTGYEWCKEKGIFHYKEDYTPVSGDIIFFLSNGASHTGIVAYCDGEYVYTIEGNASDRVDIWRMGVGFNQITGYAHPLYPTKDTTPCESFEWITGINKETNKYYWTHKSSDDSTR